MLFVRDPSASHAPGDRRVQTERAPSQAKPSFRARCRGTDRSMLLHPLTDFGEG
jgi:hypothetical protein